MGPTTRRRRLQEALVRGTHEQPFNQNYRFRRIVQLSLLVVVGVRTYSSYLPAFEDHHSRFLSALELDVPTSLGLTVSSDSPVGQIEKGRGPAIACLIPHHWEDYMKYKGMITSLDQNLNDELKTPLLLFNEGNIPDERIIWLRNLTKRKVLFPLVDFTQFPTTFKRSTAAAKKMKGRPAAWGYWQMCRFWIYKIWEHPVLDSYSTIMRVDTDSCFTKPTTGISTPSLPSSHFVYAPHLTHHPAFTVKGLLQTTLDWIKETNHTPANTEMWESIIEWRPRRSLPCFYNNFEIDSIDFFRQPQVMAFQRHITEDAPHGVFRGKWGDAPVRFLTIALYARPDQIAWGLNATYGHAAQCEQYWNKSEAGALPSTTPKGVLDEASIDRSQDQALFWHNSSIFLLKTQSTVSTPTCPKGTTVIDVNTVKTMPRDRRFNCPFERTLPPTHYCGAVQRPSHHPYRWECRLKKRLFERIDEFALREAPFTMIDLGSAYADWILAVGSYAPRSRLIPVEANVLPFRNSFKHYAVNPGLSERVNGLLAAVMSNDRFSGFSGPLMSDGKWKGPVLCDDGTDQQGVMDTVTTKSNSCSSGESSVPITTIDMIVSAVRRPGTLFFMKMDLEGAEYEALSGGKDTFSDPKKRPCIIMVELKVSDDKPYKKAYDFLLEMGYVDYEDVDSGLHGSDSWPPRGALFDKEGNYEFRLPKDELQKCAMRVLQQSKQMV